MKTCRVPTLAHAVLIAVALHVAPAAGAEISDDEFIERLGDISDRPVDRKRLARVFFSLAATLDGGKSSVKLLQGDVVVPDASRQALQSLLRVRFEDYSRSLASFKEGVSLLLDEPHSLLRLYRSLADGQRACWHLDLHNRLIETYGADPDMLSILSSREACGRLRTVAFQPRVEAIIMDALVAQVYQRQRILDLETELREMEELLADLRAIEESAAP